jgi:hypothetical protein
LQADNAYNITVAATEALAYDAATLRNEERAALTKQKPPIVVWASGAG